MDLSHRDLLKNSAMFGLAFLYANRAPRAFARQPHVQFPTRPADRLALTSWAFRAYMESPNNHDRDPSKPGMDIVGFAKMAIRKFKIHNINPLIDHFESTTPRHLEAVRKKVHKVGSRFVDLGGTAAKYYDPDLSKRKAAIESGKRNVDIARALGSPSVRPHIGQSHGAKPSVDRAAQSLGKVADYGARKGIVVNLENDDLISEDPFFIVKIIEKVGSPYLRALPDFGNTMLKGDPAYNYRGLRAMFQHVFDMSHVKDEVVSRTGKIYKVDVAKAFGIARASGYRGYFSMEYDTPGADPFKGTARLVKETLHNLS